ncbi:hypothetical protein, partial [Sinomonas sp. G460-2]|uniref:hypothetical protein n=1 Tax=Sinomonas sp. G460-2 TaxID=3393464 RepID=UPI0039EDFB0C
MDGDVAPTDIEASLRRRIFMGICAAVVIMLSGAGAVRIAVYPASFTSDVAAGGEVWLLFLPTFFAYLAGLRVSIFGAGYSKRLRKLRLPRRTFRQTMARVVPAYWLVFTSFELASWGGSGFLVSSIFSIFDRDLFFTVVSGLAFLVGANSGAVWMAGVALDWKRRVSEAA